MHFNFTEKPPRRPLMRKGLQEDVRLRRNLEINTCKVVV